MERRRAHDPDRILAGSRLASNDLCLRGRLFQHQQDSQATESASWYLPAPRTPHPRMQRPSTYAEARACAAQRHPAPHKPGWRQPCQRARALRGPRTPGRQAQGLVRACRAPPRAQAR